MRDDKVKLVTLGNKLLRLSEPGKELKDLMIIKTHTHGVTLANCLNSLLTLLSNYEMEVSLNWSKL